MDSGELRTAGIARLSIDALRPGLTAASCLYLVLPVAIFLIGWLRWWVAVPALALLAVPCRDLIRGAGETWAARGHGRSEPTVHRRQVVLLLVVAGVMAMVSGMGGLGFQRFDHLKHNAVLLNLIDNPWPVTVGSPAGDFPLVYYIAWYLPAAGVGKIAGWTGANYFLIGWGTLGLVLAMIWFCVLVRGFGWIALAVFVVFSGLDIVGATLEKTINLIVYPDGRVFLPEIGEIARWALRFWGQENDFWAGRLSLNYPSNVEQLVWAPHLALGGWIVTAIALSVYQRDGDRPRSRLVFLLVLSLLWGPWVTIGLLPILAADMLSADRSTGRWLRTWRAWPGLCAAGLGVLIALYFAARVGPLPFSDDALARFRFFGNTFWTVPKFTLRVLVFFVLEVGLFTALVWWVRPPGTLRSRRLLVAASGFLLVLPFLRYGYFNDLVMRASIPCLMVIAIFVARAISDREAGRAKRIVLAVVLVVVATSPLGDLYRQAREIRWRGTLLDVPAVDRVHTMWELNRRYRKRWAVDNDFFFRQYVGRSDSFFFRYLARDVTDGSPNDTEAHP